MTAVAAGTNSGKVALAANHLARALQPGLPAPIEEICEMRLFYSLAAVAAIVAVPAHVLRPGQVFEAVPKVCVIDLVEREARAEG